MINRRATFITALFAMAFGLSTAVYADKTLTILHTNDTHSHLVPFDSPEHGTNCGGAVRRAGLIEEIKKEGNEPLLLDGGDISQGTTFFTLFKGEASFKVAQYANSPGPPTNDKTGIVISCISGRVTTLLLKHSG